MAHEHHVLIGNAAVDVAAAAARARPLDTALACPYCSGLNVQASKARSTVQFFNPGHRSDAEDRTTVPRLEDRYCPDCGERWQSVLPPEDFAEHIAR